MIPVLTHNNHFRFGYNGEAFNLRSSPQDDWEVSYGRCQRPPFNFRDECIATAKTIAKTTDAPIWVLFSGGIDSEVALHAFCSAEIPVKVAIARFKNDLNIHDISYAVIACERMGVPYVFFDLDLFAFWQNEGLGYAKATQCVSPQLIVVMWLIDQLDGYPVLGSGECLLKKQNDLDSDSISPWSLWEKEKTASWYRHLLVKSRPGCPGFFQYTPEIMCSFLLDQEVINLVSRKAPYEESSCMYKFKIYSRHFDLISRPKLTGFEKVMPQEQELRTVLQKMFPASDAISKIPYETLIQNFLPWHEQSVESEVGIKCPTHGKQNPNLE